jgi:hypothetical protein
MFFIPKVAKGIASLATKAPRLGLSRHDAPEVVAEIEKIARRSDLSLEKKEKLAQQIRALYRKSSAPSPAAKELARKKMLEGKSGDIMGEKVPGRIYGDPYSTFYKRTEPQRAADELLKEAYRRARPDLKRPDMKAASVLKKLRDELQHAKETSYMFGGESGRISQKAIKKIEDEIQAVMQEVADNEQLKLLGTTAALSKMAEATMMPEEPSFGEKTGEFLMEWLQPFPRSWGKADPKMRVD